MLYTLRIVISSPTIPKDKPLYHLLGGVMHLFANQQVYYDAIIKLAIRRTPDAHHSQTIFLTTWGENNYNMLVSYLLTHHPKTISLNGTIYDCSCIQLHSPTRDPTTRTPPTYKSIDLTLISPTAISHGDWYWYLPTPEKFLLSGLRRAKEKNLTDVEMTDEFVKRVKHTVIVSSLRIQTVPTIIKKAPKAGVIGKISYTLTDPDNTEFKSLLAFASKRSSMVGIGKGKTLGMGDAMVKFG